MIRVRCPQDLGAAVLFIVIGAAGIYFGSELQVGSAARMGPGYMPIVVSGLIILIGLALAVKGLTVDGGAIEAFRLRPIVVSLLALAVFSLLIARFGMIVASVLTVIVAAYARPNVKWLETALFAVALTAAAVLIFVFGLGQPIPLWWGS